MWREQRASRNCIGTTMRPWDIVDHELIPGEDARVYLMYRGGEYVIQVDGRELMSSKLHGSEDALADLACSRLADLDDARILVGGLGMGFTLAAVLRQLGPEGMATVAELVPAVVRWHHEYLGRIARHPLDDSRTVVYIGDVGDLVETCETPWSAVLLDVDNGPEALTRPYNGWLYSRHGLKSAYRALIPGGILGIWSAEPDANLSRRLRKTGFDVEVLRYTERERPTEDLFGTHVLWMARRPED
jgi:spermidine synthase